MFIIKQLKQAKAAHGHASIDLIVFSAELKLVLPVVFCTLQFLFAIDFFSPWKVSITGAEIGLFMDNSHARRV